MVLRESIRAILFALLFGLHGTAGMRAAAQEPPQPPADQRTLMHMEILTLLSEIHRQTAAEVAAPNERRAALIKELAALTAQREAETETLKELQQQLKELRQERTAEAERLKSIRQAIASERNAVPSAPEPLAGAPPAPQAPLPEIQPAPARAQTPKRVFVHYWRNDQRGRAIAERIAERLAQQGFTVPEIRPVGVRVSSPSVRYFFPDDKSATDAIGSIVAASLRDEGATALPMRVQDFTRAQTKPIRGTLEVWLPVE